MLDLGFAIDVTGQFCEGDAPLPGCRIVPIGANEAYVVAPHATIGAVALRLMYGNAGDASTPADSVGGAFGGWRIEGYRALASVASNPATGEVIGDGIGSQQIAIRRTTGGGWAGQYHGFGTGASYAQTAPDLTTAGYVTAAAITSTGRAAWSDGGYYDFSDTVSLGADGAVRSTTTVAMPFDPNIAYLDMTILASAYIRASLDGGATWQDLLLLSSNFGTMAANVASIVMRNPTTGTTVTIADDALDGTPGRNKVIMRRPGDFKVYADLNPTPNPTNLGTVTVNRTITFGKTAPDPIIAISAAISQAEGNSGTTSYTYTVTRASSAGAAAVSWQFDAGTTSASDFVGGSYPAGGTVNLASGVASGTFTIAVQGDATIEADETFTVAISAVGYAPGAATSATGTILNDDSAGPTPIWEGAVNGDSIPSSGWNPTMRTWDATNKQYVFTRGTNPGGGNHRSMFPVSGLTSGQSYGVTITGALSGTGVVSAGITLGVSTDGSNGGSQTSSTTLSAAIAAGTTPYTFAATASTMYLVVNQGGSSGSDQVFRLAKLGVPT